MANVSYDTLTIQINADSKEANKSIRTLSNNLNKLNDTADKFNTRRLGEVKGLLLNIAKIDFSNVSKGLQDVVSAFKYFQSKTAQKVSPIMSIKDLDKQMNYYKNIVDKKTDFSFLGGGNTTESELEKPTDQAKKLNDCFKELNFNGKQIEAIFKSISYESSSFNSEQLKEIENILVNVGGKTGEEAKDIISRLKKEVSNTGKEAKKSQRSIGAMLKNILRYRVVRKIIQSVFQEVSQAFTELANVDENFNQSFGEIKSAFSYIARVLVSVIAPIIKVLAPIITAIAQGIGEVGNALGGAIAGALGQEEFAEAQENVESYTESLEKAKSASMGIDKLNVIGQKSEGNFEMKESTNVQSKLSETISKLIESIKPIFTALVSFVGKIQPLLSVIIDIFTQILDETMGDVNGSISAVIEAIGSVLQFVGLLLQVLKPILSFLISLADVGLNVINTIITLIARLITEFLEPLMPLLELIANLLKVIEPVLNTISETFKGLTGSSENKTARVISGILTLGISEIIKAIKDGKNKANNDKPGKNIIKFATGGFPEDGFFYANHNELVGQFSNGQTAVANNQQITQGIYQAVLQAMREGGNNGNIVINLDGYQIAKVVSSKQNNFGQNLVMGGNLNYGK